MAEKVIKSVRGTPEVFDRLAALAKTEGIDQGAALESLLNAWDVQAAKGQVPERAADVADFDAHVQGIQRAFLRSLELAQGAEQRARQSLAALIEARDTTIKRQETELEELRQDLAVERKRHFEIGKELAEVKRRLEEAEKRDRLAGLLDTLAAQMEARSGPAVSATPEAAETGKSRRRKAKSPAEAASIAAQTGEPVELVDGKGDVLGVMTSRDAAPIGQ